MQMTVDQFVVWIVVGLLGGSLAGLLVTRARKGFGFIPNLVLGLAGAVLGGLLFRFLNIWPALDQLSVSLRDIVSALAGSLIILAALWAWRRSRANQA